MNLKSAESAINGAWLTGLVIGVLTLIGSIIAFIYSDTHSRWTTLLNFADVAILFAFAYGVWRKSRVGAVLLSAYVAYLVIRQLVSWAQSGAVPRGILIGVIALLLCLNGIRGMFAYHKIKQVA